MMRRDVLIFGDKRIRRIWHNEDWFFSIIDVVGILTGSPTPRQYWGKVKVREFEQLQLSPIWVQLKMKSSDGKMYMTDCTNLKGIFRIIQSIPSKKVEPFKLWLAKVGSERIEEIRDPELAQDRARKYYVADRNVFKSRALSSFEIFPSDPSGSLDDLLFEVFIDLGGAFNE